jgi:hypothetical protein
LRRSSQFPVFVSLGICCPFKSDREANASRTHFIWVGAEARFRIKLCPAQRPSAPQHAAPRRLRRSPPRPASLRDRARPDRCVDGFERGNPEGETQAFAGDIVRKLTVRQVPCREPRAYRSRIQSFLLMTHRSIQANAAAQAVKSTGIPTISVGVAPSSIPANTQAQSTAIPTCANASACLLIKRII